LFVSGVSLLVMRLRQVSKRESMAAGRFFLWKGGRGVMVALWMRKGSR